MNDAENLSQGVKRLGSNRLSPWLYPSVCLPIQSERSARCRVWLIRTPHLLTLSMFELLSAAGASRSGQSQHFNVVILSWAAIQNQAWMISFLRVKRVRKL